MLSNRMHINGGVMTPSTRFPAGSGQRVVAKHNLTASVNQSFNGGVASAVAFGAPTFSTFLQGFVPDQVESSLVPHYREIYYYDSIGGSAVDMKSTFPFSEHTLVGLESKELFAFSESMSRMNIRSLFQEASHAYLVDSAFIGSLIFDPGSRAFKDVLIHDFQSASFTPKPFHSVDPLITVNSSVALNQFLGSSSPYVEHAMAGYPEGMLEHYRSGQVHLDPLTTLYVPRRGGRDRGSVSYLKRLLPVYLLDKILYRGTLMEAHKRQRATTHIMAGDENWIPSDNELQNMLEDFQKTDLDPLGAWVVTRNGISVQDIRAGGDFWKWTDTFDILTPYKLRALGISEAFLSGDASYATAEAAISVFLQDADAFRQEMTYSILTNKVFPILAVLHGLYRDPSKAANNDSVEGLMKNLSNQRNLKIPQIRWHKSLEGTDAASQWDMLDKLSEKGFNIPMKMLAAAAGLDITVLMSEMAEDVEVRKKMQALSDNIKEHSPDTEDESQDDGGGNSMEFSALPRTLDSPIKRKMPLLAREFDTNKQIGIMSKSGKVVHAVPNERSHQQKVNNNIVKAMRALQDPHHRKSVFDKVQAVGLDRALSTNK